MTSIWKRLGLGVLAAASAAVPSLAATNRLPGERGTVWVTNWTLNNVTALDAGTGEVVGTVGVGSSPTGVVAPLYTGCR
ncbi:MAG: hypothetical protein LC808_32215 [Actinobacteria bacterium]|nr:hypothetical protein [Actinomycetota bacterium]